MSGQSFIDGEVGLQPNVLRSNGSNQAYFFAKRFFLGGEVGDHANALQMVLSFPDDDYDVAVVEDVVLLVLEVFLHILGGTLPQLLEISVDRLWF